MITTDQLRAMARSKPKLAVMSAIVTAINEHGAEFGLDQTHRLAHLLAQVAVESGHFTALTENLNYSAKRILEVFGSRVKSAAEAQKLAGNPRALANRVYGNRRDLGNGGGDDGWNYRGRTPKQITGRANYRAFTQWARKRFPEAPDFEKEPERILENPWCGLAALWFWDEKQVNRYADQNNIEMVSRTVNGGLNGYTDRLAYYTRVALVLLGYGPTEVKRFQQEHPGAGAADGIAGEMTRMALHKALAGQNPFAEVKPVPVPVPKPTVPPAVEREVKQKTHRWGWIVGLGTSASAAASKLLDADWSTVLAIGGVGFVAVGAGLLMRHQIIAAVKDIRAAVEQG